MFLKGTLSKSVTLEDMKNKLRHDLRKSWNALKKQENDPSLGPFDEVIGRLHKFEDIRYS